MDYWDIFMIFLCVLVTLSRLILWIERMPDANGLQVVPKETAKHSRARPENKPVLHRCELSGTEATPESENRPEDCRNHHEVACTNVHASSEDLWSIATE